jgi:hypothetical protein
MRTIITLSSLGLTLALGLGSAALAAPGERYALLERRDTAIGTHYLHKRFYRHDQDRARGEGSGTTRLPDRDSIGTASPDVRKPVVQTEPVVRG